MDIMVLLFNIRRAKSQDDEECFIFRLYDDLEILGSWYKLKDG